jgi:Mlc titration factor MtfA (ptsG expression regulator)
MAKFIDGLRRSCTARWLRKSRIPALRWRDVVAQVPLLQGLNHTEKHHLRELASEFLRTKTINGAAGFVVDDVIRTLIAAQACVLILELDFGYFDGWNEIIVYPETFIVNRNQADAIGLVHAARQVLGGEAWDRGPLILSWSDACPGAQAHGEGSNVILHEFAHKLDMLNGAANGMPPLHKDMERETWTRVFQDAYDELLHRLTSWQHSEINPYAAENPAEFFAVTTELFFERPHSLSRIFPAVYDQLRQFYRQDPLQRQRKQPHF